MVSRIRKDGSVLQVCLPPDVKDWVAREAGRNFSSQNAKVVRALRATMDQHTEGKSAA